jgi:uncharacterized protein (DUF2062 family)
VPRRVIKRLNRQRHELSKRWFLKPFKSVLEDPGYWSVNRRNITRAFALGLFISFIPLPIHIITAALFALWLRLNIPVALASVFVSNPLTMVPQFVTCYLVGSRILGTQGRRFHFEMSWEWLHTGLLPVWKPFLLGCLVMGAATALIGYVVLGSIWHLTLVLKYHERKRACKPQN